ncbi:MAG TPA: hypothetical protein G4N94_03070 [Caldilineae bacterium]|nr:hypothetical protein [Caldilineae bacterium]
MIPEPQHRSFFKSPWLWTILALVLIVAFAAFVRPMAGPSPPAEAAAAVDEPAQTAHVIAENKTLSQPQTSEIATNTIQTTEEETETSPLVADTPSSENCIACHTDEEKLQELAEEPEEVKSAEAEGEG